MKTLNSLNEGIEVICNICKSLLDAQVDPTTISNYDQMRNDIKHAEYCLKECTGVTIGGAVVAAIPVIGWIPGEKSSLIHYAFYHHRNKCN